VVNNCRRDLERVFATFTDPARLAILARLAQQESLSIGALAKPFSIKLPAVMKHLDVLGDAGLITRSKHGRTVAVRLSPGSRPSTASRARARSTYMSYMMSKSQYLNDNSRHWHPHLMFYMPGEMNGFIWGANFSAGSMVFGRGEDLPGGGRMPWTLFFVPVPRWSDGTPAEDHA
jgi:DNA-binding transcriptional ArsR family regulator